MTRGSQQIPAAELDAWFAAEYGTRLLADGFAPARRRAWVRSTKQPIREGFTIVALKGYSFVPSWFVSLDFVPHVTDAGQVRWHRTEKSALGDLLVDPLDTPRRHLAKVLAIHGIGPPGWVRWRVRQSARLSVRFARAWFSGIRDVASLLPVFERRQRRRAARFGFDQSVQQRLALAFLLARLGEQERAHRELDTWCGAREQLPGATEDRLRELLRAESARPG